MSRNQRMIALVVAALVVVTVCHGFQPPPPISGAVVGVGPGFAPMQRGTGGVAPYDYPSWSSATYALAFDGVDDVASAVTDLLPMGAYPSTIIMHFAPTVVKPSGWAMFFHYGSKTLGTGVALRFGTYSGYVSRSYEYVDNTFLATATTGWHSIAHVYPGGSTSSATMYFNGGVVGVKQYVYGDYSTPAIIPGVLWLGGFPVAGEMFNGKVCEISIFDRPLLQSEIQLYCASRLRGNEPGLVRLYHCDEGSGTILIDSGPYGKNAVLYNGATWTTRL